MNTTLQRGDVPPDTEGARLFILESVTDFLTCVFSCVSDERRRDGERHAAQVALVRFLSGVSSLVIGQRARLSERLTADVADVRLLPAVQSVDNTHTQSWLRTITPLVFFKTNQSAALT